MRPEARVQTAIELLDQVFAGQPAEQTLTTWARKNRYAGSKDRAAVRDLVFEGLRNKRSFAALAGAQKPTGRNVMIGACLAKGQALDEIFGQEGYGPRALEPHEIPESLSSETLSEGARWNLPDEIVPFWERRFGEKSEDVARLFGKRAPLGLRVNIRRSDVALAQNSLAKEGIETTVVSGAPTALLVLSSPQKVNQSEAYRNGLIEIQDVASQMAGDLVSIDKNDKVLDLCAGAGGKALALAARLDAKIFIHDISEKRLAETESRAKRAGVQFTKCAPEAYRAFAPFDHVVVDAPCSGSGTWRRGPDSKWQFNFDILETYRETQVELLDQAASISGKSITYMTCSVFLEENEYQIAAFEQRHPNWRCLNQKFFVPTDQNDGLFCAVLRLTN